MMIAADEGFNFDSVNDFLNDDDDGDYGVGISIDTDSFFGILDEDTQNPPSLPNDPFYPSTEGTQECGSAFHIGSHKDLPFQQDYGIVSGNSAERKETTEQLPCMAPSVHGMSFNRRDTERDVCLSSDYVGTNYAPSPQDWLEDFNISADFPNQGLLDGTNYDFMLTSGSIMSNVKDGEDNSRALQSWLDNEIILEAQVGNSNITASEVPIFDFFDGKGPESIIHGCHSVNAYDSSSSTVTDGASPDPFLWGLMGQSCEIQAVEVKNETNSVLHKGYGCNASRASKEVFHRDFSLGSHSDAGSFLASREGHYVGVPDGPAVNCLMSPIDRKPTDLPLLEQSLYSKKEGEDNMVQHMTIKSDPVKEAQVTGESSLSEARNKEEEDDLCIIEDMSLPRPLNRSTTHEKSLVRLQRQTFSPQCSAITTPFHHSVSGTRLKATNERLVFRALMQDLCQPKSEATPPDGYLAVPLLRHQRIALSWMVQKETTSLQCSGGILADDQGLGKTVSTIALILTERAVLSRRLKETEPRKLVTLNLDEDEDNQMKKMSVENAGSSLKGRPSGGTLVVCPTSVLRQWAEELHHKVTNNANLSVLVYHGSNRTKDPYELAKFDVVLTTYSIVGMEVPRQPVVVKGGNDKQNPDGDGVSILPSRKRKNPSTSDKKRMKRGMGKTLLDSDARPLARVRWFRVVLDEAQSIKNYRTQVAQACWGLRAKRRWCLSGTPIQNAVDDLYSYFRFLKYEPYSVYKSFCSMVKLPISKSPSSGYRKLQAVLKTIMLRRTKATQLDGKPIINLPPKCVKLKKVEFSEEERDFYSRLEADSRAQFQAYAASGTVQQNYVNILLLLLRLRQACDHPLLVRGYDSNSVLKSSIHMAKQLSQQQQSCLLNCLEASLAICHICRDPPEDAVVSICGHVFCDQCISERLSGDDSQCPAIDCKAQLSVSSVFSKATLRSCLADHSFQGGSYILPPSETSDVGLVEPRAIGHFDSSKIKAALKVLQSLSKPKVSLPTNVPETQTAAYAPESGPSNADPVIKEKAIVFSQWTRMLDLLEACLKESSIQYRRLDGTMSVAARDKAVKDFNTLPEVTVMIMSLKAASLGLNMVAACHVVLLDLWWNPTTEDQAIDRAHRIGQTRPVTVVRLTVKDTVEDRILALQQKKRELVASAFGEDETGSRQTRLTVDDLKYLFMA